MIASFEFFMRRLRSRLSRTTWAIRQLNLPVDTPAGKKQGLVLIQIDGLSETQFQRAMANGRMPFLKSLLEKQEYKQHAVYSGVPSTTPAAQGEILYGVKQIVPGFCYYDKTCERIFSLFEGADAREIQSRLEKRGEPLLKGGSAYGDIYTGGAAEAHFCMTQLGSPLGLNTSVIIKILLLTLLHIFSVVRVIFLTIMELVIAITDCFRGLIKKQDFKRELAFIPARLLVCIVMREFLVIRSVMDLIRGLPVVHMNFLGYDEQAHRRGPGSRFAHWSLKGIDYAIRRVYNASRRSTGRDYDVWIYSDHGQIKTTPYEKHTGETISKAVSRVFDAEIASAHIPRSGSEFHRARMLRVKRRRKETQPPERPPIVTDLGPLGCVYLLTSVPTESRDTMAEKLVSQARVPLVFCANGPDQATAWTKKGCFVLPDQAAEVLGSDHVYLQQVAGDMVALAHHPHAGDFFISGFRADGPSLTFPHENGSHGGVSSEETRAFAILPYDAPLKKSSAGVIRHGDLHKAAMTFLSERIVPTPASARAPDKPLRTLRVLTYNVHSCAGMDGYVSPHRIARVIERLNPDIVALQELDVGRVRSSGEDQALLIARYLEMYHHFHPAIEIEKERYGDAILSRLPMTVQRAAVLPYRKGWLVDEPRGVLWVNIDIGGGQQVQVFNTHFGLGWHERRLQAEALMGDEWLSAPACQGPVIVCGDFNSTPSSEVCRKLKTRLKDAQEQCAGHKPKATFSSLFPQHRIDHIFVSHHFKVECVAVTRTHLANVASDHLPLVVDLHLEEVGDA